MWLICRNTQTRTCHIPSVIYPNLEHARIVWNIACVDPRACVCAHTCTRTAIGTSYFFLALKKCSLVDLPLFLSPRRSIAIRITYFSANHFVSYLTFGSKHGSKNNQLFDHSMGSWRWFGMFSIWVLGCFHRVYEPYMDIYGHMRSYMVKFILDLLGVLLTGQLGSSLTALCYRPGLPWPTWNASGCHIWSIYGPYMGMYDDILIWPMYGHI